MVHFNVIFSLFCENLYTRPALSVCLLMNRYRLRRLQGGKARDALSRFVHSRPMHHVC